MVSSLPRAVVGRPRRSLLAGTLAVLFTASILAYLAADQQPLVDTDPAFYQHVGWYVTRGGVPYVDVWDINPPLTFGVAAVLSAVAGGNLPLQHALGVLASVAAIAAGVGLTASLAADLTGDDAAAAAAGLVLLVPPEVYGLAPYGLRSQYFALASGVLALLLARRDRPLAAGASAAVAAGFWQPGGGIALLVVGMAAHRGGRAWALRAVGGGLAVAGLVVLPFVAVGAFVPMVAQTVLGPFYGQEPYTLASRTYALVRVLGYGAVLVPVALGGWALAAVDADDRWWIPAGGIVYGLQVALVNMNGSLDAILFLVFVALGVGIVVAALPAERRTLAVAAVVLLVLAGPAWHLAPGAPLRDAVETRYERADPDANPALDGAESSVPEMQTVYWEKREPDTCHYRLSHTELRWIAETDARLDDRRCGRWPGWPG